MQGEIKTERINIKEFDISKWKELLDEVYPTIAKIFVMSKEQLSQSLFHQNTTNTVLHVFRDGKKVVGLNLINIYEYNYKGEDYSFFRFLSGILPEYRGKSNIQKVGFMEAFKYAALNPLRSLFYLGPFIHPSSYAAACKISNKVYPSLKSDVPEEYFKLMMTFADIIGLEKVEGEHPLVRNVKFKTIEKEGDKPERISNRAKFFLKMNPNYHKGYGLITMAPMNFKNVTESFMRYYSLMMRDKKK